MSVFGCAKVSLAVSVIEGDATVAWLPTTTTAQTARPSVCFPRTIELRNTNDLNLHWSITYPKPDIVMLCHHVGVHDCHVGGFGVLTATAAELRTPQVRKTSAEFSLDFGVCVAILVLCLSTHNAANFINRRV